MKLASARSDVMETTSRRKDKRKRERAMRKRRDKVSKRRARARE